MLYLLLLLVLLIVPSANFQLFDGLPLSSLPEFFALLLLLPLLFDRGLRRLFLRAFRLESARARLVLSAAILGCIAGKLILYAFAAPVGFKGCYSSPAARPPMGKCEVSYENLFRRLAFTRLDRSVVFEPAGWNLSFVNSLRFNLYPIPGHYVRDRLPLHATWSGVVEFSTPSRVRITYVGEGRTEIGPAAGSLLPSYSSPRRADLAVPAGRHDFRLSYEFDEGYRSGNPEPLGPYATLRVEWTGEREPHRWLPLPAAQGPRLPRLLGLLLDLIAIAVALSQIGFYLLILRQTWMLAASLGLASLIVCRSSLPPVPVTDRPGYLLAVILILLALLLARPCRYHLLLGYGLLILVTTVHYDVLAPAFDTVRYRSWGNDWLTYESYARSILEELSLMAGEPVFYHQPLSRYVNFGLHATLGDGDVLPAILGLVGLNTAWFWLMWRLQGAGTRTESPQPALVFAAVSGSLLLNSHAVTTLMEQGASEYPTWIALPVAAGLLLLERSVPAWVAAGCLVGISAGMRPNQIPGLALLWLAGLLCRPGRRPSLTGSLALIACAALPLAHNLLYGHRWVLFTTTADHPATLTLPPTAIAEILEDRARLVTAARQLFLLAGQADPATLVRTALPFRLLAMTWFIAVVFAFIRRRGPRLAEVTLLVWPAAYLAVHFFYDAFNNYPRHIVVGYLAMAIACAALALRPQVARTSR